jgi:hypothetical protein
MRRDLLRANINFYISVTFVGSFMLFMTVVIFKVADVTTPIDDIVAAAVAEN